MLIATIATILALHAGAPAPSTGAEHAVEVQYRVPRHPPPCGDHWDQSARDGMCYPNGFLPPEDQAALQRYNQGRVPRHPPPCGDHWDQSARDGMCYPNGYLPPEDQAALQGYYRGGYDQPRPYYRRY